MRPLLTRIGPLLILAIPSLALAAAPGNLRELASWIVNLIDQGIVLLIALALLLFFYGTTTRLFHAGEGKGGELRSYLAWGVVVLFVMVSIWGILYILQNTLFGGTPSSQLPDTATNYTW